MLTFFSSQIEMHRLISKQIILYKVGSLEEANSFIIIVALGSGGWAPAIFSLGVVGVSFKPSPPPKKKILYPYKFWLKKGLKLCISSPNTTFLSFWIKTFCLYIWHNRHSGVACGAFCNITYSFLLILTTVFKSSSKRRSVLFHISLAL